MEILGISGSLQARSSNTAVVLAASVDNKPAVLEQADTGAGSGPAAEADRIAAQIERQSMETTQRGADG